VLAALLGYPDERLRRALPEFAPALRAEGAISPPRLGELEGLIEQLRNAEPLQVEADYVERFDRGRATSLHLFEHVHGDSRDRGPALIDLGQTYARAGLILADGELPDYLPAVLEFASTQPAREARAFLGETGHIVNAIFDALQRQGSAYASVLGALLELSGAKAAPVVPRPEPPLDESWAEPPAFDGCSAQGQARPGEPRPVHVVRPTGRTIPTQGAPR
jgi:nitrate reductase delta subunit